MGSMGCGAPLDSAAGLQRLHWPRTSRIRPSPIARGGPSEAAIGRVRRVRGGPRLHRLLGPQSTIGGPSVIGRVHGGVRSSVAARCAG
jgi:hypothetical protein